MEVQHIKLRQVLKVANILDIVLTKHKDPERWDRMQIRNFLDLVVVKVKED